MILPENPFGNIIKAIDVKPDDEIWEYSNPTKVFDKGLKNNIFIFRSTNHNKKYMIFNPNTRKWVHFGAMGYEDYTKHKDKSRRDNFLSRSSAWKGINDIYSPAFLSRYFLW